MSSSRMYVTKIRLTVPLTYYKSQAGVVSIDHLDQLTQDKFMRTMRINTLSVFLAIKYASSAMSKPNPSRGKLEGGGSIILTASGESLIESF